MNSLRPILLVEDSAPDIELTLAALDAARIANPVDVVHDGVEALAYLHREGAWRGRDAGEPAVVLLDLKMPRLDGLEVLRQVKSDARLRTLPIVMLTSSAEERDLVESYRLGANAYVVKPVDFAQFTTAVRDVGMFWAVLNQVPPFGGAA